MGIRNQLMKKVVLATVLAFSPLWATAAGLKALSLQATGGVTLAPNFVSSVTEYRSAVQSDIAAVEVSAQPEQEGALISITVNGQPTNSKTPKLASLKTGQNVINVRVAEPNTQTLQSYAVTVERQDVGAVLAKFRKLEFKDPATGAVMPYRLFVPQSYQRSKSYPLVVFLHGGGERGNDNEKTLTANQGGTIWAMPGQQRKHPAFVLVPQARDKWDGGFGLTRGPDNQLSLARVFETTDDLKTAHNLLLKVLDEYPSINRKRLYVTGLSQGGFGAWNWNIAHPELFAALVAIAGGADPAAVKVLKDKPAWAFHAASDPVIPVTYGRNTVEALKAAGGQPHYTEYDASTYFYPMAHFSWVPAFRDAAMREWLFAQSLR
ncbi:MAG: hypothetical protein H6R17_3829 [Proteobacteria bacterium]|nr:hypothetical protein [Pseudomonadota bacterium]